MGIYPFIFENFFGNLLKNKIKCNVEYPMNYSRKSQKLNTYSFTLRSRIPKIRAFKETRDAKTRTPMWKHGSCSQCRPFFSKRKLIWTSQRQLFICIYMKKKINFLLLLGKKGGVLIWATLIIGIMLISNGKSSRYRQIQYGFERMIVTADIF